MSLVFQYGSNTLVERLNSSERLNGGAKVVGTAYTFEKFDLDFTVWSRSNHCAAADIVPQGSMHIWGVLYEIPDNLIYRQLSGARKSLDAIEGEGGNYQRKDIQVILSNDKSSIISVLTYVVRERRSELKTSSAYASEILKGLKTHNMPKNYLRYVYGQILKNNSDIQEEIPSII